MGVSFTTPINEKSNRTRQEARRESHGESNSPGHLSSSIGSTAPEMEETKGSLLQRLRSLIKSIRIRYRVWKEEQKLRKALSGLRKHFKKAYKVVSKAKPFPVDDFLRVERLGSGNFGRVELVLNRVTSSLSAMKIVDKDDLIDEESLEHLVSEWRITGSLDHPFLVSLWNVYKDETRIFMEMQYYPGGDLFSYVIDHGKCSRRQVRFYGAQIAMGVDFLHSVGVVHRDLKPENILIDADGYLKIVDLGLAKKTDRRKMSSSVGTPNYMAPEMHACLDNRKLSYDKSVDWWAFGITIFTVATGREPFNCFAFAEIASGRLQYPRTMSISDMVFLKSLLEVDRCKRLGCGKRGGAEIMAHDWFADTDWNAIFFRKVTAPYVPEVRSLPEQEDWTSFDHDRDSTLARDIDFSDF